MQKVDLNEGSVELPVWVFDRTKEEDEGLRGFWFSFDEPVSGAKADLTGPYDTPRAAVDAAGRVAHEAVRAQATQELLSQSQGH